jgi:hypothetical protein
MAHASRSLIAAVAFAPYVLFAQTSEKIKEADPGSVLLDPSAIKITGDFEILRGPTTLDLTLRSVRQQLDEKQAAEAAKSPLEPLWKDPMWKYLPGDPGRTLNSPVSGLPDNLARNPLYLDDPYCRPAYLSLEVQHLDHELVLSEKQRLWLFGH